MSSLEVSKVKTIVNTGLAVYIWNTGLLYLWLLFGSLNNNTFSNDYNLNKYLNLDS